VSFPVSGGPREVLSADRTYYVRPDGNDGNDGLSNSSGGAFLTIQKAIDVVYGSLDIGSFNVTIQLADGTYTAGGNVTTHQLGNGTVTIKGNAVSPQNVVVNVSATACFRAASGAVLTVQDMELRSTGSAYGLLASAGGYLQFQNLRFGACGGAHVRAEIGAIAEAIGDYAIAGNAPQHWNFGLCGIVRVQNRTVTLSGTPAFSYFALGSTAGQAVIGGNSFVGAATGARYHLFLNACVNGTGGNTTYFPGDAAGDVSSGAQYG
jgi:hypothetical protein